MYACVCVRALVYVYLVCTRLCRPNVKVVMWIGQGRTGQDRAGQGRAGRGGAGRGGAGQGRAGQGRAGHAIILRYVKSVL